MNPGVVRGALWANELLRLERLDPNRGDYVLTETRMRVSELASAMDVDASVVRQRLERGCRAFVARSRTDAVVSWLWVSTGREWADPLRQLLRFAPDECHGWNAGTLLPHRGRGLCTALLRYAGWRMGQEGRRLMWNGILDDNLPSQSAHAHAGMRPIVRLTAVHEPAPTQLRVRAADYAAPELVLRARRVVGGEAAPALIASGARSGEGQR
jgi:hypothetical protein